jgi:hypothetical protein
MSMRFPRQWEEELFSVTGERRDKDCCSELCCIPRSWRANQSKSRPMNISRIAALLQVLCSSRTTEITYRLPRSARPSSSLPSWFESNPPDSRLHTSASPGSPHRDTPHLPSRETARPTRSLPFQSATTPPCYRSLHRVLHMTMMDPLLRQHIPCHWIGIELAAHHRIARISVQRIVFGSENSS